MSKIRNLSGLKFGKLTVVKRTEDKRSPNGRNHIMYICKCDCVKTERVDGVRIKEDTFYKLVNGEFEEA